MKIKIAIIDDCKNDIENAKKAAIAARDEMDLKWMTLEIMEILSPKEEDVRKFPQFDIMLLDIEMEHLGGYDVVKLVNELQPKCKIIMMSHHIHYALKGYHYRVYGFVGKPFDLQHLNSYLMRAMRDLIGYGTVEMEKDFKPIEVSLFDIPYFETAKKGSIAYNVKGEALICTLSIKQIKTLYGKLFFSIGTSVVVNLGYVDEVDKKTKTIYLTHGEKRVHEISHTGIKDFKEAKRQYVKWKGKL